MSNSIEKKLAEYRNQKRLANAKIDIKFLSETTTGFGDKSLQERTESEPLIPTVKKVTFEASVRDEVSSSENSFIDREKSDLGSIGRNFSKELNITNLLLKLILWTVLLLIFIELEFAAIFIIISLFYLIYTNTRVGPKIPGEPSAYSVFNPNCEAIEGTTTAEQMERQFLYGPILGH